jgi:Ca2+:H+ antiporter
MQVESIDALTATGNIGETFVGLILLPIVGNAAEHATAVTVACKDKMDLAIGVAVGSSMQIALLVLPLIIVLGWIIGEETMVWMSSMHNIYLNWELVLTATDSQLRWIPGDCLVYVCSFGKCSQRQSDAIVLTGVL